MKIPFSPPYINDEVVDEVVDTLRSGWITTGPKVKALENLMTELTGCDASLGVNSATSGLMLALHWYGIGRGDEVIVPAYTYTATALAVMHTGATPVMVDVGEDFCIDPDKIEEAITERTKAIIPVDFGGWPCDYDRINALIRRPDVLGKFKAENDTQSKLGRIFILSDAAHSIGASYKGQQAGRLCDISVFSFHAVKNVTTAEGGVVCLSLPEPFDAAEVYSTLRLWTLNGQTKDAFTKSKAGGWKYDIVYPGFKINMPDVCAAIGLAQLRRYKDEFLLKRFELAERYRSNFEACDWAIMPPLRDEERSSSCHLFALRIKDFSEDQRDEVISLISEQGIAVNVHFIPMPLLTIFKDRGYKMEDYPITYNNFKGEISLPIYTQLTVENVDLICETVINAVAKVAGS